MNTLDAALQYAGNGWPLFPVAASKKPLTSHGRSDATQDANVISAWLKRWPDALIAVATGAEAGIVAIDVDIRETADGRASLQALGVVLHPQTPTAHTPSGGFHMLFKHPGGYVKTVAGKLGPALDIRGDGGSIILPPGPARFWDPHLHISDIALATFPAWAALPEEARDETRFQPATVRQPLSRYGEAALDNAVDAIISAGAGEQEITLNRQAFGLGQLVGGGEIPAALAEEGLMLAARQMSSFDRHRPWVARDLQRKIRDGLFDGMKQSQRAGRGC